MYKGWRRPRTHNELVANCRDKKYVRGRRSIRNIPTAYDDIHRQYQRSWKRNKKCKRQFGGSRDKFTARSIEYE